MYIRRGTPDIEYFFGQVFGEFRWLYSAEKKEMNVHMNICSDRRRDCSRLTASSRITGKKECPIARSS